MKVLWPMAGTSEYLVSKSDINDKSIVFRFDFREHSSLFAGDLYFAGEDMLIQFNKAEDLDADLLKVPHHGHATSSSTKFLMAVSPELSVAMARVPIPLNLRKTYTSLGGELLYDLVNGYIHIAADADGVMEYETTRNHDPNLQSELNIPSDSLVDESA